MSLKRPDSSYLHLYWILLTFFSVLKPAEGQYTCPPGYYVTFNDDDNGWCAPCVPGTYQPKYDYTGTSCTYCAAGTYSRYVSYTSARTIPLLELIC